MEFVNGQPRRCTEKGSNANSEKREACSVGDEGRQITY